VTDILDRRDLDLPDDRRHGFDPGSSSGSDRDAPDRRAAPSSHSAARHTAGNETVCSPAGKAMVVTLAGAAALLAISLVAAHLHGSLAEGLALLALAWVQAGIAALVLFRPSRGVLGAAVVIDAVVVAAWLLSRTGSLTGIGHSTGLATTTLTGIALAIVAALSIVSCCVLLAKPGLGSDWSASTLVLASMAPIAVFALATTAIAVPTANGSEVVETASSSAANTAASSAATTPTSVAPGSTPKVGARLAEGESAETAPDVPLDPATQQLLGAQLTLARAAAMRYPTAGDARRAGMIPAGGSAPGLGAHFQMMNAGALKGINPDGTVNPAFPTSYIYLGEKDTSPLVGVMFTAFTSQAPEGFAGPNDHWHRHSNLCLKFVGGNISVPVAPDSDVTKTQCDALGGFFQAKTVWMVHAWVVPGWESPLGVFSHSNPNVHCDGPQNPDGSDRVDSLGFCVA
jgi:hypothetical protein